MRPFFLFVALCVATVCALAQKVTNAAFEQVGKQVRITYQLDKTADIQVLLSTDGGKTFGSPLRAVTGDVGKNVTAGNKTIVWSPLEEREKLVSDNVVFKVVPAMRVQADNPSNPTATMDNGRLPGWFSVSSGTQVQFTKGNLQYQASTNTWRFAEHQWDMVGMGYGQTNTSNSCYIGGTVQNSDNRQIGSNYNGWIDLFGWGTGNAPTKNSTDNSDYQTFVDWGTNAISNGGNQANMWRTLTKDEWYYLFSGRANASSKYGVGMVNGINGMIVLPDEFTLPSGLTFTAGMASSSGYQYYQTKNNYSAAEWARMEACGALFLPAAGYRDGSSVGFVGYYGYYQSSTPYDTYNAYDRFFCPDGTEWNDFCRYNGFSVRLVR